MTANRCGIDAIIDAVSGWEGQIGDQAPFARGVSLRDDSDSITVNELHHVGMERADHTAEGDLFADVVSHDRMLPQCGRHVFSDPR